MNGEEWNLFLLGIGFWVCVRICDWDGMFWLFGLKVVVFLKDFIGEVVGCVLDVYIFFI